MIRFEGVCSAYGTTPVLRDVTLAVEPGETLAVVGPSGAGKTTLLKLVNRLVRPTAGRVLVDGRDVAGEDPIRLRRRLGYVIQEGGLLPHLTVGANVGLLARLEGWPPARIAARVRRLLAQVGLPADRYGERFPEELSGGERQRVGVARALVLDPPVLLMDEPFGALDPITREEVQDMFQTLQQELRKTVLLVTHDLAEAFRLADRVALLVAGKVVQVGREEDFRRDPRTPFVARFFRRYLGRGR